MIRLMDLVRACGAREQTAVRWLSPIAHACSEFNLTSDRRLAHFLAQIGHESMRLERTVEDLFYRRAERLIQVFGRRRFPSEDIAKIYIGRPMQLAEYVYGGRYGNRPTGAGDGWHYRGSGLIMTTFADNHRAAGERLGIPFRDISEALRNDALTAARGAAAYFVDRCLPAADADDAAGVVLGINPGAGVKEVSDRVLLARTARASATWIT